MVAPRRQRVAIVERCIAFFARHARADLRIDGCSAVRSRHPHRVARIDALAVTPIASTETVSAMMRLSSLMKPKRRAMQRFERGAHLVRRRER